MFSETQNSPFPDKCIYISSIIYTQIHCKPLYLSFYLYKYAHNELFIVVLLICTTINYKNNCTKLLYIFSAQ